MVSAVLHRVLQRDSSHQPQLPCGFLRSRPDPLRQIYVKCGAEQSKAGKTQFRPVKRKGARRPPSITTTSLVRLKAAILETQC